MNQQKKKGPNFFVLKKNLEFNEIKSAYHQNAY